VARSRRPATSRLTEHLRAKSALAASGNALAAQSCLQVSVRRLRIASAIVCRPCGIANAIRSGSSGCSSGPARHALVGHRPRSVAANTGTRPGARVISLRLRDITCDQVGACGSLIALGGAAERRTSRADFLTHRGHPLHHGDRGALQTGFAREDHPGAAGSNTAAVRPLGSSLCTACGAAEQRGRKLNPVTDVLSIREDGRSRLAPRDGA
jgi:hypothetical protein